jgi:hypothetical protein|tara:strand:+ start:4091 stop:4303 length:213 start_codon:yes stop_codon:yes gene_type:complete
MNIGKFKELLDVSIHINVVGDYEIRRYRDGGGYVIIDALGDFIILTEDCVDGVCGAIFGDLVETNVVLTN